MEPPGIAPGSGPLITSAFIAIFRASPNALNIGRLCLAHKGSVALEDGSVRGDVARPVGVLVAEPCQLALGIVAGGLFHGANRLVAAEATV